MRIVPEQQAFIVERLGKYDRTLGAGFHLLIPLVERIRHRRLPLCIHAARPDHHAFEMGRIDLDRSFSERDEINDAIVRAVDEASDPWGIKVTRYEVRDISTPDSVLQTVIGRSASTSEPPTAAADGEP